MSFLLTQASLIWCLIQKCHPYLLVVLLPSVSLAQLFVSWNVFSHFPLESKSDSSDFFSFLETFSPAFSRIYSCHNYFSSLRENQQKVSVCSFRVVIVDGYKDLFPLIKTNHWTRLPVFPASNYTYFSYFSNLVCQCLICLTYSWNHKN